MLRYTAFLFSVFFGLAGLAAAAQAAPTNLRIVEGEQTLETIEVGVTIEQSNQALLPVLADLRFEFDSGSLEFVRAESMTASKSPFGHVLRKGVLRVTLTGFSLSTVNEGPLLRLVFKKKGAKRTATIGFAAATKLAPNRAHNALKLAQPLTMRLTR